MTKLLFIITFDKVKILLNPNSILKFYKYYYKYYQYLPFQLKS